jgi:hypothetical protein
MQNLANMCNNSGLPFFIVESILKDFLQELRIASQRQIEIDKARYNEELTKLRLQAQTDTNQKQELSN